MIKFSSCKFLPNSSRKNRPDDAEEIDVGVVDGEVDEDGARAAVEPEVLLHLVDDLQRVGAPRRQVLHEAAAGVRRDQAPVIRAIQVFFRLVAPPAGNRRRR